MKIPERFYMFKTNLVFCLAAPVYVFLFVVLYAPTFNFPVEWLEVWRSRSGLCLPICCAIEMGVLLISRSLLSFAVYRHKLSEFYFLVWQMVEFVATCLFISLFLALNMHLRYFDMLSHVVLVMFALNVFPYAFYWVFVERLDRDARIAEANSLIWSLRKGVEQNEKGMIRFADEKGNTKLVVSAERVISVESAGNYVTILYDDNGKLMRYSLRNTLKGVEDVCASTCLVRCHRSFLVNINKVKIIRRTPDGVFAEIEHTGVDNIPVSKSYASELLRLFSEL